MLWAGSRPYDVYVGTRGAAVCHGDQIVLSRPVADFDAALAMLGDWMRDAPTKSRLRIWISGGVCRPFILAPVPGITSTTELCRVAAALAPRHTGLRAPCEVWLDRGKIGEARVAVALQSDHKVQLLEALGEFEAKIGAIVSLRPWWGDLLRAVLDREPATPAVAVHDCDSLTVLAGEGGKFEVAATLAPVVDRETADAALARMLLAADVDAGREVVGRLALGERAQAEGGVSRNRMGVALYPLLEISR